ncbi:MAG: gamma-glutamyltransferase family protein [Phycisphaeraceae bacterium]
MHVYADNLVATSQPLATQAGVHILRQGGNAVDAAIATAIALTVVEPVCNGLGSDAFAIVHDGGRMHGLNGSGRSPAALSPERFAGQAAMPRRGWDAITVPGCVDLWSTLHARLGRLDFGALFEPAIHYARRGFPVSPIIARQWADAADVYRDFPAWCDTFLVAGRAPAAGEHFACESLARTLELVRDTRGEAFYHGELATRIADDAVAQGGLMSEADLAAHETQWVEPIAVDHFDVRVHELPPNGQGAAALIALGILEALDIRRHGTDTADGVHLQVEAMKLAFADAFAHVADPDHMRVSTAWLLDRDRLAERARAITLAAAHHPAGDVAVDHGTVYIAAADADGMMVSFIQSNYEGFGSGVVIPGTGISMQNRAAGFTLEPGHPNEVAGGKRPFHTIIPAFVTRGDKPAMAFGVMGGHMQAQGHVQMILRCFGDGQHPQATSDAPRWHVTPEFNLAFEPGFDPAVVASLEQRGHRIVNDPVYFGGAQLIQRTGRTYTAGSDHRKDGQAAGF